MKVTFNDFQLEAGSNLTGHCWNDKLTFYDGTSATSSLLGSYCGTLHPEVIYSTGRHLYVKFHSDSITTLLRGFRMNVLTVAEGNLLVIY